MPTVMIGCTAWRHRLAGSLLSLHPAVHLALQLHMRCLWACQPAHSVVAAAAAHPVGQSAPTAAWRLVSTHDCSAVLSNVCGQCRATLCTHLSTLLHVTGCCEQASCGFG